MARIFVVALCLFGYHLFAEERSNLVFHLYHVAFVTLCYYFLLLLSLTGGHLAVRKADNQFILRESAQCAKDDESSFQDVTRHLFFNTNNLWVRLDMLKALMEARGGFVPLPTILNSKTVDPQQDTSTAVFQLEVR